MKMTLKPKKTEHHDNTPVEHTEHFKIVVVLDESGSMNNIKNDMKNSLNSLIEEQKQVKNKPCNFTLVKFNNNVTRVINNIDIQEVSLLTDEDYVPDGTTALYDAVGDTMNWFRYERDVLLVVVTDGQNNASRFYKKEQIMNMLKEKEDYANWTFVYLGCDLQTATQGSNMGFRTSKNASNCTVVQESYCQFISDDLNTAVKNYRKCGMSVQSQLNK